MGIALVSDSTCDMADAERTRYKPVIVPLHVVVDGTSYMDGVDLGPAAFYTLFKATERPPTSSQPNAAEFERVYANLLETNDSVVSIHISGRLSGTFQSAAAAAQSVDPGRIRVVDSRQVSVGLGLVVGAAGEAVVAGASLETVVATAEKATRSTRVYGTVPSLDAAVKGGRVSARVARFAGLIELKPIIAFDREGGTHIDGGRLGYLRAIRGVVARVARFAAGAPVQVIIVHAGNLAAAEYARRRLRERLGDLDIPIVEAGAVITTHVGLGTIAIGVRRLEIAPVV
ncbi:MAG TPA: DegV family protein [Thermoleophilia bacterium]